MERGTCIMHAWYDKHFFTFIGLIKQSLSFHPIMPLPILEGPPNAMAKHPLTATPNCDVFLFPSECIIRQWEFQCRVGMDANANTLLAAMAWWRQHAGLR